MQKKKMTGLQFCVNIYGFKILFTDNFYSPISIIIRQKSFESVNRKRN